MLNENMFINILKNNFDVLNKTFDNIDYNKLLNVPIKKEEKVYFDFSYRDFEKSEDYKPEFTTSYVMPLPFEDFSMLCDVSHGSETMSLVSLYKFSKVASNFGYSSEIFSQALINRFSFPLILLICFMLE